MIITAEESNHGHAAVYCDCCDSKAEDVMELRLCESRNIVFQPNRLYYFTVDPNCPKCVELAEKSK